MFRPVRLFFVGCALALLAVALPAAGGGATQVARDTQTFAPGAQVAAANWTEMPNLTTTNAPPGSDAVDNAVSCVNADFCMAVGAPGTLHPAALRRTVERHHLGRAPLAPSERSNRGQSAAGRASPASPRSSASRWATSSAPGWSRRSSNSGTVRPGRWFRTADQTQRRLKTSPAPPSTSAWRWAHSAFEPPIRSSSRNGTGPPGLRRR